jgi:nucleoside-diphosphate-sugar epimerase
MTINGKTILVTGASGFLGGTLAIRLAGEGAMVKALVRIPEKGDFLRKHANIEIVQGDILEAERMLEIAQDCSLVYHTAALMGRAVKKSSLDHFRKINVEGTRNIMNAAVKGKVARIIYVSTIQVYGFPFLNEITEDIPLNPGNDFYSISKAESEGVIEEISKKNNFSFTIIRPGAIYGPGSNLWTKDIFKLAKRNPVFWVGKGNGVLPLIYIDDLVDLMIKTATHPAANQEVFNAVMENPPTIREYISKHSSLAGHQNWIGIPIFMATPFAHLISFFVKKNSKLKDLPLLIKWLSQYRYYKMTKAAELLDWKPNTNLETGIKNSKTWLRQQGLLN